MDDLSDLVFLFVTYMAFAAAGVFGGQWIGQQIAGTAVHQTTWSNGGIFVGLLVGSVAHVAFLLCLDNKSSE